MVIKRINPRFGTPHLSYIEELALKREDNNTIANGLNSREDFKRPDEEDFTPADVDAVRAFKRLPPCPTCSEYLNKTTSPAGHPSLSVAVAASKKTSAPRRKKGTSARLAENFDDSAQACEEGSQATTHTYSPKDKIFKPVLVKTLETGKIYYLPGAGPVKCEGQANMEVAGYGEITRIRLTEVYSMSTGAADHFIQPRQIAEKGIRFLSSVETIDAVKVFLESGKGLVTGLPKQSGFLEFFKNILGSNNIGTVANLLSSAYRRGANTTEHEFNAGNRALHMISAEYAVVKDVSFDAALSDISTAVKKPTLAELREFPSAMRSKPLPYDIP